MLLPIPTSIPLSASGSQRVSHRPNSVRMLKPTPLGRFGATISAPHMHAQ